MLKRIDDLIGAAADLVTCERGHRMSHGQRYCERCPKPGEKPKILNEEWPASGAYSRLLKHRSDPEFAEMLFTSHGYLEPSDEESIGFWSVGLEPKGNPNGIR